ncbi:MAG: inorganic phosphate transporter [Asgard group archaeon]|nr:inorganic phosphate transporter [Asgard group archaeon]
MDVIAIALICISMILAFAIGANDETYASIVGIKRVSVNVAVFLGAIIAFIGSLLFAPRICDTLQNDISTLNIADYHIVVVIFLAMATSLILASFFGLPISSTQAMIGAILGLTIIKQESIIWTFDGFGKIIFTWLISPIVGFVASFLLIKIVNKIMAQRIKGLQDYEKSSEIFGSSLFFMVIILGLSRSGNDLCNAIAPIVPLFQEEGRSLFYQYLPIIIGGLSLGLGLIFIGRRVLQTLGNDVVKLTPETGFATQTASAIIIFIAVFFGIPISGTMVLVSSFVGAGIGGNKPVNFASVKMITLFAFLTPILSAVWAIGYYYATGWMF